MLCRNAILPALVLASLTLSGCASSKPRPRGVAVERGVASWYGPGFHARLTASGERYDMDGMTAAHPTLPFGTLVEVRNLDNGRTTVVRINDRGPFAKNRIIDLSRAAAREVGMIGPGTARVELVVVGMEAHGPRAFAVQVGAFQQPDRAEELAARLRGDFPGVVVSSDAVWHRVQVGTFAARADAERLRARLARRGYAAIVVPLSTEAS